jgi:hypothetical protein
LQALKEANREDKIGGRAVRGHEDKNHPGQDSGVSSAGPTSSYSHQCRPTSIQLNQRDRCGEVCSQKKRIQRSTGLHICAKTCSALE